jgi:anti-sigma B factor antagonist
VGVYPRNIAETTVSLTAVADTDTEWMGSMEVRTATIGKIPLLDARGDIDHSTCGNLQSAMDEAFTSGHNIILVDLNNVTYVDSGGLSVLLAGVRSLREKGWLGVIGPNANLRRLFEIVGLLVDPSFRVFDSQEAAKAAVADLN